jgi:hypothetical protein
MALPYVCAKCGSPWPADKVTCWSCGNTERVDNPAFGKPSQEQRMFIPPADRISDYHPDVSQTPYQLITAISAAIVGVLVYISLRGQVNGAVVYALLAAFITAANVWLCCLIYITKSRVDRIGRVLDDVARAVRR